VSEVRAAAWGLRLSKGQRSQVSVFICVPVRYRYWENTVPCLVEVARDPQIWVNTDPDPGFEEKNLQAENFKFFFIKKMENYP
jgi:hypothetical protein